MEAVIFNTEDVIDNQLTSLIEQLLVRSCVRTKNYTDAHKNFLTCAQKFTRMRTEIFLRAHGNLRGCARKFTAILPYQKIKLKIQFINQLKLIIYEVQSY